VIEQPLSDLAVEIIREALADEDQQFVFESPVYKGQPIHRTAMATALRGTVHEKNPDKSKTPGLCELLGLKPFTPHDLRRTAATLAGELGYSDAAIAKCLDHAVTKDDGEKVNRVTGIYNQSKRMQQKRAVLDGIAAELRRIVGEPAMKVRRPGQVAARSLINGKSAQSARSARSWPGFSLLKPRETRCLAADAFGVLPGVWVAAAPGITHPAMRAAQAEANGGGSGGHGPGHRFRTASG
jgi:Phage integrase family